MRKTVLEARMPMPLAQEGSEENLSHGKSNRGAPGRTWWLADQEGKAEGDTQVFILWAEWTAASPLELAQRKQRLCQSRVICLPDA